MQRRGIRARLWAAVTVIAVLAAPPGAAADAAPRRVVSMNVCTDQLAMLLAAPGQLHSVSFLASQSEASAMAEEARAYRPNHGLAEEIFLMQPDLVIAGASSTRATVSMLRRLGFRVEEFTLEQSFEEVRANIRRMGAILGHERQAEELVASLDEGLAKLARTTLPGGTVATYAPNSFTAGRGSLTDAVIAAAGLENLGSRLGIQGAGRLPLEVLVLARPDIITHGTQADDAPALARQNFVHPAYRALITTRQSVAVPEAYWICGGPFNLLAAKILQDAGRKPKPADRPRR